MHCLQGACEDDIKDATKATVRVVPFGEPDDAGPCVRCGQPAAGRAVIARAY